MTGSVVADVLMDLIDQSSKDKQFFTDKEVLDSIKRAENNYKVSEDNEK